MEGYRGNLENRTRFPIEVFDADKAAVSEDMPVWVRVSATDWGLGGSDVERAVALSWILKGHSCAALHLRSGGVSPIRDTKLEPGYQVYFAQRVKTEVGLPTIAIGPTTEAAQAEEIMQMGQADAIPLARSMLYNTRWPWHAAAELGAQVNVPEQYWRCHPNEFQDMFKGMKIGHR